ncbi:MAG: hypothetical protein BWY06_01700 [Candidatus Latescibacteria bacterium ADurb.Bin168]|nr:MAG: hypothetical protein BWY06_01700 [Candidatus Latescibacteria bacterium ADurb.Bin168]
MWVLCCFAFAARVSVVGPGIGSAEANQSFPPSLPNPVKVSGRTMMSGLSYAASSIRADTASTARRARSTGGISP